MWTCELSACGNSERESSGVAGVRYDPCRRGEWLLSPLLALLHVLAALAVASKRSKVVIMVIGRE